MEAQSLLSRLSIKSSVPSFKDFRESLYDPSIPSFLQSTKWNCVLSNPAYRLGPCRITNCRKQFVCAISSQKAEDFPSDSEHHKLKPSRKRLAVFVSGGGSNFKAIHEATRNGTILGDVVVLVTNKGSCGGATYAEENGIPVVLFPRAKEERQNLPNDLVTTLREFNVDFILLAGYLKLIPVVLVQNYPKRILNIHPSLLPAFGGKGYYGLKVHKAVIASGARYSGPTIHYVDEEYDTGRILAQQVVPVHAFDTPEELATRVLHEEHQLYVDVVAALCEDRIIWRGDGVPLIQSKEDPHDYSPGGICVKKTSQALIVGIYDEPPGQSNMIVERLGDYLVDQGLKILWLRFTKLTYTRSLVWICCSIYWRLAFYGNYSS